MLAGAWIPATYVRSSAGIGTLGTTSGKDDFAASRQTEESDYYDEIFSIQSFLLMFYTFEWNTRPVILIE